jgi:hypothetical protein
MQPGFKAQVKATGSSVAVTAEAFGNSDGGAHLEYQVTDVTKRIMELADGITVYVDSGGGPVAAASTDFTVNALFGKVTFGSALGSGDVVTADFSYLPATTVAAAKAFTLKVMAEVLETTAFSDVGEKTRIAGLMEAQIDLELVEPTTSDYCTDGGFDDVAFVRNVIVVEVQPDTTTHKVFRAFVRIPEAQSKAAVAGLVEGTVSFRSTAGKDDYGTVPFGFGANN